jgi:hypothetical protein
MKAYEINNRVFEKTAEVRRSSLRQSLCSETGLSHEQIEGWFNIVLIHVLHQFIVMFIAQMVF